ncbi:MAG: NUDIX domain-containing protein [Bacteroidales bacterium]
MASDGNQEIWKDIRKYVHVLEENAISQLSINCVILGFDDRNLQVAVNRVQIGTHPMLLLPGGYVGQRENVSDAVRRIVRECTGMEDIPLRQFDVFGSASRSFFQDLAGEVELSTGAAKSIMDWLTRRFISLCYLALVDFREIALHPTEFYDDARWIGLDEAGCLALDHPDMVRSAREYLRKEMPHAPIASRLLPDTFTLPDLQALVEAILDRRVDRPNFRRKILGTGLLRKVGQDRSGIGRPADLYSFVHGRHTALVEDFRFGF